MDPSENNIIAIVALAVYPFAMAGVCSALSHGISNHRRRQLLIKIFAGIGMVAAVCEWLSLKTNDESRKAVLSTIILISFIATGAAAGAAWDRFTARRWRDNREAE